MLFTIRRPWLLRFFGWGTFNGKPRTDDEMPNYVTAGHKLWWHWLRQGVGGPEPNETELSKHKIVL